MGDVHDTRSGKEYNAETTLKPVAANGHPTNSGATSPSHPERDDDHAEAGEDGAAPLDQYSTAGHEMTTDNDNIHKDAVDDHGEEVVEAAEDTVIY